MKAVQLLQYHKQEIHIAHRDVAPPTVGAGDVLVRVCASGVNPLDLLIAHGHIRLITPYRLPVTLGNEFSGVVEQVGSGVTSYRVGDEVIGRVPIQRIGTMAEYVSVPADTLAPKPSYLSHTEAAAVPLTALTACQAMDLLHLQRGQSLFISGGSGSFGAMAIPLAVARGLQVSTSGNAANSERVRALGVEHYFDYKREDYAQHLSDVDGVIDTLGDRELPKLMGILRRGGVIVSLKGTPERKFAQDFGLPWWKQWLLSLASRKTVQMARQRDQEYRFIFVQPDGAQLREAVATLEREGIRPAIDQVYRMDQALEALQRVEQGGTLGKVIIEP